MSRVGLAFAALAAATVPLVHAGAEPLSVRENFRIGSGGSILCSAQSLGRDEGLAGMFDRGYSVICRDATAPVGLIYAVKGTTLAIFAKGMEQPLRYARKTP